MDIYGTRRSIFRQLSAVGLHDQLRELQQVGHLPASPIIKVLARDAHGCWAITITSDGVPDHVHHFAGSDHATLDCSQLITRPVVHLRLGLEDAQLIAVAITEFLSLDG